MRKRVAVASIVLGIAVGGWGTASADPPARPPACDKGNPAVEQHNKHCNGGEPGGRAGGSNEEGSGRPVAAPAERDVDGDGAADSTDNCPTDWNPRQLDRDGDGVGNACELDHSDGDGVPDGYDNCSTVDNADQSDTDGDGAGDACDTDDDGDGIGDGADNCPTTASRNRADTDGDGSGDACDTDDDGDLAPDVADDRPHDHQSPGERVDAALTSVDRAGRRLLDDAGL